MKMQNDGPSRTRITLANGTVLYVSYETCVAASIPGQGQFRTEKVHSRTTSKHIGQWCMTDADKRPQAFFDSLFAGV